MPLSHAVTGFISKKIPVPGPTSGIKAKCFSAATEAGETLQDPWSSATVTVCFVFIWRNNRNGHQSSFQQLAVGGSSSIILVICSDHRGHKDKIYRSTLLLQQVFSPSTSDRVTSQTPELQVPQQNHLKRCLHFPCLVCSFSQWFLLQVTKNHSLGHYTFCHAVKVCIDFW